MRNAIKSVLRSPLRSLSGGASLPLFYQVGATYWPAYRDEYLNELSAATDLSTASCSAMSATLTGTTKWLGGTLGADGKIYGIPFTSTDTDLS